MSQLLHLTTDCDCPAVLVSLKNDVLTHFGEKEGIYKKSGKVNGKTSWNSTSRAIWFNSASEAWVFSHLSSIGNPDYGAIASINQGILSCPYNVPNFMWKYYTPSRKKVIENDVNIQCLQGTSVKVLEWSFGDTDYFY